MRIRKFNEAADISTDRISDIVKELGEVSDSLIDFDTKFVSLSNELSGFKSEGDKNDQIDDVVIKLDQVKSKVEELSTYLSDITKLLESYNKDGRKFIY